MSSGHHRHKDKPSESELDDLLDEALADSRVKAELAKPFRLVLTMDMPYVGSASIGRKNIYFDRHLRHDNWPYGVLPVEGRRLDVKPGLTRHERLEPILEDVLGWSYLPLAHFVAQHWEERDYKRKGFDPKAVEKAFAPYIKADEHERLVKVPTDLDLRPVLAPPRDEKLLERISVAQSKEKVSHDSVDYRDVAISPKRRCELCAMFIEPEYGGPDCTLVKPPINAKGGCRRFVAGKLGEERP